MAVRRSWSACGLHTHQPPFSQKSPSSAQCSTRSVPYLFYPGLPLLLPPSAEGWESPPEHPLTYTHSANVANAQRPRPPRRRVLQAPLQPRRRIRRPPPLRLVRRGLPFRRPTPRHGRLAQPAPAPRARQSRGGGGEAQAGRHRPRLGGQTRWSVVAAPEQVAARAGCRGKPSFPLSGPCLFLAAFGGGGAATLPLDEQGS